jgi:cysteine desulfurase
MKRTIYMDYNATTPLDQAVRDAMLPYLGEVWGNPSSIHHVGQRARAALDEAHDRASSVLGCKPSEVIFTSGGTESNNLAVLGAARLLRSKGRHIISSAIEHHAVLHCLDYLAKKEGFEVTLLPVSKEGVVAVESLVKAIRPDTVLVSIMAANNEVGSLQPVSELGEICMAKGVLFHTDAVQWFGKERFVSIQQFNADLVSVCAHKFHGPKGAGLLYIRSPLHPDPILFGGGHENERRAGTENLAGCVGLVEAMDRFVKVPVFNTTTLMPLKARLAARLSELNGVRIISPKQGLPNTVSFVVDDSDSTALVAGFDLEGICVSGGAACSAGSLEPSHVVRALGFDEKRSGALVRFSMGRDTSTEELDFVLGKIQAIIARCSSNQQAAE